MTALFTPPAPILKARSLQNPKGGTLTTTLTDDQALQICAGLKSSFANDLAQKARGRYGLSAAQMFWVHKLAMESVAPQANPGPAPVQVAQDMTATLALFRTAAEHLQHPKVRLLAGDQPVALSLAGGRSKYAGQVMVTDGERYPDNKFFGRVDTAGAFHPGRDVPDEVVALLAAFAADPAGTAASYGRLTGTCCFCTKPLSDPRSTAVGYGRICAAHFSLDW